MKKALLAGLCFVAVCLVLIHGPKMLPELTEWLGEIEVPPVTEWLDDFSFPDLGGNVGKPVHVTLVSDTPSNPLFPGGSVTRTSAVRNDGEGGVCYRLVYAIQYNDDSWHQLDIDFLADKGYDESDWQLITIDGTPFMMKVFTYTELLAPGSTSPNVVFTIGMDRDITNDQIGRYRSDFLRIQVVAIDPTPFMTTETTTVVDALDMALPLNNLNPF